MTESLNIKQHKLFHMKKRVKRLRKMSIKELWGNIKRMNIYVIEAPKGRQNEAESTLEVMTQNVPN